MPRDVMQVPVDDSILWAGNTADVRGLAVGADGLVVLHQKSVEGISAGRPVVVDRPVARAPGAVGRGAYREAMRGDAFRRTCRLLGERVRGKTDHHGSTRLYRRVGRASSAHRLPRGTASGYVSQVPADLLVHSVSGGWS